MCPRTPRPGQGLQHTLYTLVYTAALALSSEPALLAWPVHCIGFLSLAVSRVHLVCCLVVRSSSSPEMVRVPEGCSRAWTSTSAPLGGWRRSTQASRCTSGAAATLPRVGVGPAAPRDLLHRNRGHHACRGRCYTRPCARAKGPSSFSAVRRQDWLDRTTTRQSPRGE